MGGERMMELENIKPRDIERRSFEIISDELQQMGIDLDRETELIVKRCIHTSADFEYAENLCFSAGAVSQALQAIRSGASIVTDTQMAMSGINKRSLGKFGGQVYNFMSDADVAAAAKERGCTRAAICMEKAAAMDEDLIYAIGNAPTALIRLHEMMEEGLVHPRLIIGVPVGFVNVVQSKELILQHENVPYIVARGRKGGSNIAACICNALLYMLDAER